MKCKKSNRTPLPIEAYKDNEVYYQTFYLNEFKGTVLTWFMPTIKQFKRRGNLAYRSKNFKNKNMSNLSTQMPYSLDGQKFFNKRYYLFSKFDAGIKLDEESWYSVTPEEISKHIARRVSDKLGDGNGVLLDAFCGCGGNTIQFGKKCKKVIANDYDLTKSDYAKHNSGIYFVEDKIKFLSKDFLDLSQDQMIDDGVLEENEKVDVVFLSPPWGGTGINNLTNYTMNYIFPDFHLIMSKAMEFSKNLIWFLPRNTGVSEICQQMAWYAEELGNGSELKLEIEKIQYKENIFSICIYFGDLCNLTATHQTLVIQKQYIADQSLLTDDQTLILRQIIQEHGFMDLKPLLSSTDEKMPMETLIQEMKDWLGEDNWNKLVHRAVNPLKIQ